MKDSRVFPENKTALGVIVMGFAFLILFWWYPLSKTFILAFKVAGLGSLEEPWVGLANYRKLFSSKVFRTVVLNTLYFAGFTVPAQILLGLAVSSIIDRIKNIAFKRLSILSFYAPYILPIVALGILWKFLYHPSRFGIFNFVLSRIGLEGLRWLDDPKLALTSIAIVKVWQRAGYVILLYFAGLQAIPRIFYEAAEIDGANAWQKFRRITLPLLTPTTLFVVVTSTINALMVFESIYIMTLTVGRGRGGPINSTNTMLLHIYQTAFRDNRMGYASAATTVLFLMILGVTFVQLRLIRQKFEY